MFHNTSPKHSFFRPATKRPPVIDLAVRLSWISLLLGTIYSVSIAPSISAKENGTVVLAAAVGASVVMVLAIVGIGNGRNWARMLSVVLLVLGLRGAVLRLDEIVNGPAVLLGLEIAIYLVDFYVLFLIYSKPGALWFQSTNDNKSNL